MKWGLGLAIVASATSRIAAQELRLEGQVMRATLRGERPVIGAPVVLHRIGDTTAGPVDSTTTDRDGMYRFRVSSPDTGSMYLATSRHEGIAYFAAPVRVDEARGPGEILVFDTTSAPVRLRQVGRHLVVSAPGATGAREVVEVWELGNDSVVTRVGHGRNPAFVARVPANASKVRSTQGDFAGTGVEIEGRDVRIVAPIAPGIRQLVVTYELPPSAFPLTVDRPDSVDVFEVLLEEAGATVTDARLEALGAVPSEGRNFLRFLGRDVPAGRFDVVVPVVPINRSGWPWLLGLGLASLGAVAWSLRPGRKPLIAPALTRTVPPPHPSLADTLLTVEASLESPDLTPAERGVLEAHREALRGELDAMADRGPSR